MKNIKKIKVVLPLILGLGGVVQGSSFDNDDLRNDVRVDFSSIAMHPARQMPVPEEKQVYLFGELGSERFIFIDGAGNPIFFPAMELTDFLCNAKCFVLSRYLFRRIAKGKVFNSMKATYGDSEIGDEIRDRINYEKSHLSVEAREGRPVMILMKNGWTKGKPFAMIDGKNGELYHSVPDGVDMKAVYRVKVSETLYKKLMSHTYFESMVLGSDVVDQALDQALNILGVVSGCCLAGLIGYCGIMGFLGF